MDVLEKVERLWNQGDREGALKCLRAACEQEPSNVQLAYELGHMLGELSMGTASSPAKDAWRAEAIQVLSRLCGNLEGVGPDEQWKIRRHYYLYSGQHLQNKALGLAEIQRGNLLGFLSVGMGCLYHAVELLEQRRREEAQVFAREARDAFKKLLEVDTPKWGRLLAYARALALVGCEQEAQDVTSQAAERFAVPPEQMQEHEKEMERLLELVGRDG